MRRHGYGQVWKENPKPFYFGHAPLASSGWHKLLFLALAMIAVYVVLDGIVMLVLFATLTHEQLSLPPALAALETAIASAPVHVDNAEMRHLSYLNAVCTHEKDAVISWSYNSSTVDRALVLTPETPTPILVRALSDCPDIDVFLPSSIRDHGYCEDSMAYVKYLQARALPEWVVDRTFLHGGKSFTYFDLCPRSAMLFLNHYWHDLPTRADFPPDKPVVLMPNVEMYELNADQYRRPDYILAKTWDAYSRLTRWVDRHNESSQALRTHGDTNQRRRLPKVRYTQHTSSDPTALVAKHVPKSFQHVSFVHANGRSVHKSTCAILDCWKARPDLPPLVVLAKDDRSKAHYESLFPQRQANVEYRHGADIDPSAFGEILAAAPVMLCPSAMEGFGHYINQARAAGALVATTDGLPMREFVDASSGVLVDAELFKPPVWSADFWSLGQEMGRHYKVAHHWRVGTGMEWTVSGRAICDAVDKIVAMSPRERQTKAAAGRMRYLQQLKFFKAQMLLFLTELRADEERRILGGQPSPS
ncbi:hypothetical protein DYB32_006205 [Aphanomyces invadans]|uniref:Glycosyl transferase family 1 domain-containing protein n=1 Tax=Aphanomyces invadans TaxID=157072 RepID=A0A418AS39_9STRA|nr:hypothetical protein DYB32_006205 [Aphanomyces invadans]